MEHFHASPKRGERAHNFAENSVGDTKAEQGEAIPARRRKNRPEKRAQKSENHASPNSVLKHACFRSSSRSRAPLIQFAGKYCQSLCGPLTNRGDFHSRQRTHRIRFRRRRPRLANLPRRRRQHALFHPQTNNPAQRQKSGSRLDLPRRRRSARTARKFNAIRSSSAASSMALPRNSNSSSSTPPPAKNSGASIRSPRFRAARPASIAGSFMVRRRQRQTHSLLRRSLSLRDRCHHRQTHH